MVAYAKDFQVAALARALQHEAPAPRAVGVQGGAPVQLDVGAALASVLVVAQQGVVAPGVGAVELGQPKAQGVSALAQRCLAAQVQAPTQVAGVAAGAFGVAGTFVGCLQVGVNAPESLAAVEAVTVAGPLAVQVRGLALVPPFGLQLAVGVAALAQALGCGAPLDVSHLALCLVLPLVLAPAQSELAAL